MTGKVLPTVENGSAAIVVRRAILSRNALEDD